MPSASFFMGLLAGTCLYGLAEHRLGYFLALQMFPHTSLKLTSFSFASFRHPVHPLAENPLPFLGEGLIYGLLFASAMLSVFPRGFAFTGLYCLFEGCPATMLTLQVLGHTTLKRTSFSCHVCSPPSVRFLCLSRNS